MVTRRSLSDCSNSTNPNENDQDQEQEQDQEDTVSVTSASASSEDGSIDGQIVLADDIHKEKPSFGNVSVANSSDIHFGNKTYYQGPVTIKQFLYANPQLSNGEVSEDGDRLAIKNATGDTLVLDSVPDSDSVVGNDNPSFVPDCNGIKFKSNIDDKIVFREAPQAPAPKGARWLRNFSRQHAFLVISLSAVLLVSLVTLMTVLLTRHQPVNNIKPIGQISDSDEQEKATPVEYPVDTKVNLTLPGKLKIVSRKEWLAQPPVEPAKPLALPVHYIIIGHTATENCSDQASCVFHVRFIQTFHIESRNWWDIGYNFLVGGDGFAYEGRGWKSEGAHTYGYNSKSIGIAFIGTFNSVLPPKRQILAAQQLIEKGVSLGYVAEDYKILAARQLQTTLSPGLKLYEDMKTWPHWAEQP